MNLDFTDSLGVLAGASWTIVVAALKSSHKQTVANWIDAARAVWGKEEASSRLAKLDPDKVLRALVVIAMLLSLWWATFFGLGWLSMKLMPAGLIFGGLCLITGGILWATFGPAPGPVSTTSEASALNQQIEAERESRKKSEGEVAGLKEANAKLQKQLDAKHNVPIPTIPPAPTQEKLVSISPNAQRLLSDLNGNFRIYQIRALSHQARHDRETYKNNPMFAPPFILPLNCKVVVTFNDANRELAALIRFAGSMAGCSSDDPPPPLPQKPLIDADSPPPPPFAAPAPLPYVIVRYPDPEAAATLPSPFLPSRQRAPKMVPEEVEIIRADEIAGVIEKLRSTPMFAPTMVGLFCGLRAAEICALRWVNVDLDGKVLHVKESVEEVHGEPLVVKAPKTEAGNRAVSAPDIVVRALREVRRQQLEQRLALGLGKPGDDALVFPAGNGGLKRPSNLSRDWHRANAADVNLHATRHTRLAVDRRRPRRGAHQQATWPQQPDHHPVDLRPSFREG